ncbi:MAG: cytochrome c-type biogenesis protein CcmH [Sterolibacterium sp.]|jgi:cytochrome c-type biogenesis protein CcmH|nr:cytochrome c-type biogenesis protein CcmH [Sterolibacterium sp.]
MKRRFQHHLAVLFLALGLLTAQGNLLANEATPLAADPIVEQRMVAISEELRCLVCQNESLAGSRAELAQDLRREIRDMIKAGKSNDDIMTFMVDRYGDYVRYRPPMKATTWVLWFGPFLLLLGGLIALIAYLRQRSGNAIVTAEACLTDDERRAAEALLNTEAACNPTHTHEK